MSFLWVRCGDVASVTWVEGRSTASFPVGWSLSRTKRNISQKPYSVKLSLTRLRTNTLTATWWSLVFKIWFMWWTSKTRHAAKLLFDICDPHATWFLRHAVHVQDNGGTWFWDALHLEYNAIYRGKIHAWHDRPNSSYTCTLIYKVILYW